MYSVTSRKSFEHLDRWLDEIRQNANKDPVVALVGNKCDLPKRKILGTEAAAFAKAQRLVAHDTSAKTGEGVEEAFVSIARTLLQTRPELFDAMPVKGGAKPAGGAAAAGAPAAAAAGSGTVKLNEENAAPAKGKKKGGCC